MPAKHTVLIVEDTRTIRRLLTQCLEAEFIVIEAENGEEGIKQFQAHSPDVILMDVEMPKLNGFETCEAIRKLPAGQDVPIMMVTGLDDLTSITKAYEAGATDFMPKPLAWDTIKYRVRYMIRTSQHYLELKQSKIELSNAILEIQQLNQELEGRVLERTRQLVESLEQIKKEQKRADDLLKVIFPPSIVQELKKTNTIQPKWYKNVAILFVDVVNFTGYCEAHTPDEILANLQELIKICEDSAEEYGIQKIKTIGDAFMAMAIPKEEDNPVLKCIQCAETIIKAAKKLKSKWKIHAGIHVGDVMGGIVGRKQYLFDIWGDTVNTAARLQQMAKSNCIYLSKPALGMVKNICQGKSLGEVEIKGKKEMEIFEYQGTLNKEPLDKRDRSNLK